MKIINQMFKERKNNFIFLGEAGSGKSEIALNFAAYLQDKGERPVHFFDMDMTKPLFRSRDAVAHPRLEGIQFHYEEQFMDAPTLVGGARRLLNDKDSLVVMDVGGDNIGARSIGGLMAGLDRSGTAVFYVVNAYRPWSRNIRHIDGVLGAILAVSHIEVDEIRLVNNPNLGADTTLKDVLWGTERMTKMTGSYRDVEFTCVRQELFREMEEGERTDSVGGLAQIQVLPIQLFLTYPWITREEY